MFGAYLREDKFFSKQNSGETEKESMLLCQAY